MDSLVSRALLSKSPAERARLLGCVTTYVTSMDFVNLLANIDVNSKDSIFRWTKFLAAFNSNETLRTQVESWLRAN
jgi:type II secretory pathway component PulL